MHTKHNSKRELPESTKKTKENSHPNSSQSCDLVDDDQVKEQKGEEIELAEPHVDGKFSLNSIITLINFFGFNFFF